MPQLCSRVLQRTAKGTSRLLARYVAMDGLFDILHRSCHLGHRSERHGRNSSKNMFLSARLRASSGLRCDRMPLRRRRLPYSA
jgi:hypothetical protein